MDDTEARVVAWLRGEARMFDFAADRYPEGGDKRIASQMYEVILRQIATAIHRGDHRRDA